MHLKIPFLLFLFLCPGDRTSREDFNSIHFQHFQGNGFHNKDHRSTFTIEATPTFGVSLLIFTSIILFVVTIVIAIVLLVYMVCFLGYWASETVTLLVTTYNDTPFHHIYDNTAYYEAMSTPLSALFTWGKFFSLQLILLTAFYFTDEFVFRLPEHHVLLASTLAFLLLIEVFSIYLVFDYNRKGNGSIPESNSRENTAFIKSLLGDILRVPLSVKVNDILKSMFSGKIPNGMALLHNGKILRDSSRSLKEVGVCKNDNVDLHVLLLGGMAGDEQDNCRHASSSYVLPSENCIECGKILSEESHSVEVREADAIDKYLNGVGKARHPVTPDGHCILRSWSIALREEHNLKVGVRANALMTQAEDEILLNLSYYGDYITGDCDIVYELEKYKREKDFTQDVVDLMIYALCNCTRTAVTLIHTQGGEVIQTFIKPTRENIEHDKTIYLAKIGCHYEPILPKNIVSKLLQSKASAISFDTDSNQDGMTVPIDEPDIVTMRDKPASFSTLGDALYSIISSSDEESIHDENSPDAALLHEASQKRSPAIYVDLTESPTKRTDVTIEDKYSLMSDDEEDSKKWKICRKKTKKKVCEGFWAGVNPEVVEYLPEGIDGLKVFVINKNNKETRADGGVNDGRRWKKSCPTQWLGHSRVRYADCKGSNNCVNGKCPFKIQFGVMNTKQFEKKSGELVCKGCGRKPQYIECFARRYISDNKKQTKVYHCGKHTCPVFKTVLKNKIEVSQLVKNNPNIKPAEIQSSCILAALRAGEDWRNVEKQAEATLDRKWISNLKQKLKNDIEPLGHDFEAVVTFKGYCDKKDDLYVYKINDSRGNPDMASFAFKTSKQKALMALNMDRNGEHFLKDEYCYFDGKRKRCRGFVTLTSSLYHPLLRKQVPLATMEAVSEDTENVQLFWRLFNEVLKKVSRLQI